MKRSRMPKGKMKKKFRLPVLSKEYTEFQRKFTVPTTFLAGGLSIPVAIATGHPEVIAVVGVLPIGMGAGAFLGEVQSRMVNFFKRHGYFLHKVKKKDGKHHLHFKKVKK